MMVLGISRANISTFPRILEASEAGEGDVSANYELLELANNNKT